MQNFQILNTQRLASKLALIFLILLLSACSSPKPTQTSLSDKEKIVIQVSFDYLTQIQAGNMKAISGMVLWSDYQSPQNRNITKRDYIHSLQKVKTLSTNPFENLKFKKVIVEENDAEIFYEMPLRSANQVSGDKPKRSRTMQEVSVKLTWVGAGWLVYDDNLFGDDGIFANS